MAKDGLCFLVCENHTLEVSEVVKVARLRHVKVMGYPSSCFAAAGKMIVLTDIIRKGLSKCGHIFLVGSHCTGRFRPPDELPPGVIFHPLDSCPCMFTSKKVVDWYQKQGALVLTPGLLNRWRECMKEMGFDQKAARKHFRASFTKLILLDTGVIKNIRRKLKDLSEFLGLPCEPLPVGLDHLHLYLDRIILMWQIEQEKHSNKQRPVIVKEIPNMVEKRAHERYRIERICLVEMNDSEMVELKDISLGGVRLNISRPFPPETIHAVKIFTSMKHQIQLAGTVVWSSPKATAIGTSTFEVGLKFAHVDQDTMQALNEFFKSLND